MLISELLRGWWILSPLDRARLDVPSPSLCLSCISIRYVQVTVAAVGFSETELTCHVRSFKNTYRCLSRIVKD